MNIKRLVAMLAIAITLAVMVGVGTPGCSWLGVENVKRAPNNLNESIYIASATVRGMAQNANDLRAAAMLTREQHHKALDALQSALDIVKVAQQAYVLGDLENAQTNLDRLDAYLRVAAAILALVDPVNITAPDKVPPNSSRDRERVEEGAFA